MLVSNNKLLNKKIGLVKKKGNNDEYLVNVDGDSKLYNINKNDLVVLYNNIGVPKNIFKEIAVLYNNNIQGGSNIDMNDPNLLCNNLCDNKDKNYAPLGKELCRQAGFRTESESRKCLLRGNHPESDRMKCCNTYKTAACSNLCTKTSNLDPLGKVETGSRNMIGTSRTSRKCFQQIPKFIYWSTR